jgi:hypothetical protein
MTKSLRAALVLLWSAISLLPNAAFAQVTVWDPEEIARLAEKSAQMAVALSRAVELLNSVNDLSRTIGRFGSLSNMDFGRLDMVEGLRGAGPEIGGIASNIAGLRQVKIASFDDARKIVQKLTSVPSGGDQVTKSAQVRQGLDALHRRALEDGYSLALHTRESLSIAPARAGLLAAEASAPIDLRGDIGANTAASLAVLEQLTSLKAMLAATLEIRTSGALRNVAVKQDIQQ